MHWAALLPDRDTIAGILGAVVAMVIYWYVVGPVQRDTDAESPDLVTDLETFRRRAQHDDVRCAGRIRRPLRKRST